MKIKYLREILKHYTEKQYDDWDIVLWDYNNQRELELSEGIHTSSKVDKRITFPVKVEPPVDGKTLDERLRRLIKENNKK